MEPVDLALILAFDCSASVTFEEFGLMAGGCAAALRAPEVLSGLTAGPNRASLCALLLWSGHNAHEISIEWTRIANQDDLLRFAGDVDNTPRLILPGATAIGEALLACEQMLAALPAPAQRLVIDVVGDGRSNEGADPVPVRDRLAAAGVTINGLCVLHEEPDLLDSYRAQVIAGPDAFALQCQDYDGFAAAMQQKLQQEIAAVTPPRTGTS